MFRDREKKSWKGTLVWTKAQSMRSSHIFCTNGLSKVYIVFRASVFAITRCSLCSFFMLSATHRFTIPFYEMSRCPSVQVCPKSSPFPVWNSILAMIHIKVWQSFHIWQLQQFQSISYLYTWSIKFHLCTHHFEDFVIPLNLVKIQVFALFSIARYCFCFVS